MNRNRATSQERLRALMNAAEMNASDLGRLLGNRALGNKLLRGERQLPKTHIRRLADHFAVDPGGHDSRFKTNSRHGCDN